MVQCGFTLNNHKTSQLVWTHFNALSQHSALVAAITDHQHLNWQDNYREKGFLLSFIKFSQMTVASISYT